ncbi:MAG TPA: hypothetical protein VMH27_09675 [Puia sp.]|nr:hypothetical protein [Puia sp.]
MTREILRLMEARPILADIHEDLLQVIRSGFADWLRIREFAGTLEGGPVNYKARTKAGIIHDHIEKFVRARFANHEAVRVDDFNGIFGMVVHNKLFVRFKKMDSTYSVRSFYTRQHTTYMQQGQIPGFPEEPTFLFAGYIPDRTWSNIKGIYVACWIGDTLEWVDEFGRYSAEQAILDFDQQEPKAIGEIEKRIKLKRRSSRGGRKTGTDNEDIQ